MTAHINRVFSKLSSQIARGMGTPWAFFLALFVVLVWALVGPVFGYSDTWQLVINTSTTIITFLMVFLIQHTQNCDTKALHLKLDELIFAISEADNALLDAEDLSEEQLRVLAEKYRKIHLEIISGLKQKSGSGE